MLDKMPEKNFEIILKEDGNEIIHRHLTAFANFSGKGMKRAIDDAWDSELDKQAGVTDVET